MSVPDRLTPRGSYPQGERLATQIRRRHSQGNRWKLLFQLSTIVGIIALTALLYNVLNEAFGLVVVQNAVDPERLVLSVKAEQLLHQPRTVASEHDEDLVDGVSANVHAIGFFGNAYYARHSNPLRRLSVDGIEPTAVSVAEGTYPLARPLYLYTTADILTQNPAAAAFVHSYLSDVNETVDSIGYFPASAASHTAARQTWLSATGRDPQSDEWLPLAATGLAGKVNVAGSSTVEPLTRIIADRFSNDGFSGQISIDTVGTTAGLGRFCEEGGVDIAAASRPMLPAEFAACREQGRLPIRFHIAHDALVLVVNQANTFIDNVTLAELGDLFLTADQWTAVNAAWPAAPIERFVPGPDSGTLDVFLATVQPQQLADLTKEQLSDILIANISRGLGRRLERDQRFFDERLIFEDEALFTELCSSAEAPAACRLPARSQTDIYQLVVERVVEPELVQSWSLIPSLLTRAEIESEAATRYPAAQLIFRSWVTADFLTNPQSSQPQFAGVRTALFGTLWVVLITMLFSFPVGVGAAIYLEEYAADNRLNRIIETNINNLAGVPSIIYGILGLAIFVRALELLTSGALFGVSEAGSTANGRTILSAGLTLGLLIMPLIIINAQEAIRAVPNSLRQASLALGATHWQTIWYHVLPGALPGILTGTILAMSRAIGETAPLVVVGASTFITVDPNGPFAKFTTLPIQIFQWTSRPQAEFRNIAAAAILVLLVLLLFLNATAVLLRNRAARRSI